MSINIKHYKLRSLSFAMVIVTFFVTMLSACDDALNEFSNYRCYLVIENNYHQNSVLASAMNPNNPGMFCVISLSVKNGARCFHVENSDKLTDDIVFNGYDARRSFIVGKNNGLIVGYGKFSSPLTFYAFDRECPNCFNLNTIPVRSYPLTIASDGFATCNTCKRKYNLNSGGNIAAGEGGKKLERYHASASGPFGVITVQ